MEHLLKKYEHLLKDKDFEVICTPKLSWIILRTDYMNYSNPVIQIDTPEQLENYILNSQ